MCNVYADTFIRDTLAENVLLTPPRTTEILYWR